MDSFIYKTDIKYVLLATDILFSLWVSLCKD